jgi:hypothetical protein
MYAVPHLLSSSMSTISTHDIGAPLPSNLSKLTVSQLKAICKERRIVGYSKLGKAALVRKLGELGPSSPSLSSAQNTQIQAQASSLLPVSGSSPAQVDVPLAPAIQRPMGMPSLSPREPNTVPGTHLPQSSATSGSIPAFHPPSGPSGGQGQNVGQSVSALKVPVSKRVSSEIPQGQVHAGPLAKKPKVSSPLSARADIPFPTSAHRLGDCSVPESHISALPDSALVVPGIKERLQLDGRTQTVSLSGQRFKPLRVTEPLSATLGDRRKSLHLHGNNSATVTVQPSPLWHLDFPLYPETPLLSVIAIPPPLSQRKLVQRWAIILSGLSGEECFRCCLVSKLIRYAGEHRMLD